MIGTCAFIWYINHLLNLQLSYGSAVINAVMQYGSNIVN